MPGNWWAPAGRDADQFQPGHHQRQVQLSRLQRRGEINAVKLLVDGVPANSNDGNMPYIDGVFPLDIAGIEVVRGTSIRAMACMPLPAAPISRRGSAAISRSQGFGRQFRYL
jgi:hypothetical protein